MFIHNVNSKMQTFAKAKIPFKSLDKFIRRVKKMFQASGH